MTNTTTEDKLISEAMAILDHERSQAKTPAEQIPENPATSVTSPTLASLDETRHPKAGTICEHCPGSVWFASPVELKCYCRVMYLVTWSSQEPSQITHCDGEFLNQM